MPKCNGPPIDGQFTGFWETWGFKFKASKQNLMGLVFPSFSDKPNGYFTLPDA